MSAPLVPSPLDYIGRRRFAFYPAIENGGPNEWTLGVSSWSEVQAINAHTGTEIWIPRQHIGAVADNSAILTVGLRKVLDFHAGSLTPRIKRVIEMPQAREAPLLEHGRRGPASVIAIRLEDRKKSSVNKAVLGLGVAGLLLALLAAWISSAIHF
jgi:hypothetical protein